MILIVTVGCSVFTVSCRLLFLFLCDPGIQPGKISERFPPCFVLQFCNPFPGIPAVAFVIMDSFCLILNPFFPVCITDRRQYCFCGRLICKAVFRQYFICLLRRFRKRIFQPGKFFFFSFQLAFRARIILLRVFFGIDMFINTCLQFCLFVSPSFDLILRRFGRIEFQCFL